jgi:peptidoglycan/LPS O-acetylase OafA/YrhL
MKPSESERYRADIDGLRAVAVLAVALFHAFPRLAPGGFVGVDIFFVISGFLISGILFRELEASTFSFAAFYARRVRRIFPALILVLAGCLAAGWFLMQPDQYRVLGREAAAGAAFAANLLLWREAGYFDAAAAAKPLLHLWSLGVEEQYYLIWPAALFLAWRARLNLLWVVLTVAAASFALCVAGLAHHPAMTFYSPLSRFWELMTGAALAYVALHRPGALARFQDFRAAVGLGLAAVAIGLFSNRTPFPGVAALAPVLGAALLLSSPGAWLNRKVLASGPLRAIGLVSYPFYLWHWPLLYAVRNLDLWSGAGDRGARALALLVGLLLAVLTYLAVERPIRFGVLRRHAAWPAAAVLALVAAVGVATAKTRGFDYRIAPELRRLAAQDVSGLGLTWRNRVCFLNPEQDASAFGAQCAGSGHRPELFIWGDSYAATLYQGLDALGAKRGYSVAQYTASSCPPVIGVDFADRPLCKAINEAILRKVAAAKPETVLLGGNWYYGSRQASTVIAPSYDYRRTAATIAALRQVGVRRIMLMGPTPHWETPLPSLLIRCQGSQTSIGANQYSTCGKTVGVDALDREVEAFARAQGVIYLSPYQTLCNGFGCLTTFHNAAVSALDIGHPSPEASRFLAERNADRLAPAGPAS